MTHTLTHTLDRSVLIRAPRETVFRFFTDNARWAAWWGAGSSIEPHPGGRVFIRYPGGTEVTGEIVEIDAPERIVFTYGYVAGVPIPAGSSLVTIALDRERAGTRVRLTHAFAEPAVRDQHVQGWRYQLSLFANAVATDAAAPIPDLVDRWFAAWSEPDAGKRNAALEVTVVPEVAMRDRFSAIEGYDDLVAHLAAMHHFMPGMTLARDGDVRQCQGVALADWIARGANGQEAGRGRSSCPSGRRRSRAFRRPRRRRRGRGTPRSWSGPCAACRDRPSASGRAAAGDGTWPRSWSCRC
jgi:uncharacterized protein YndB with AHSA1/START domain